MKQKKLVVIISNVYKAYAFEWAAEFLTEEIDVHYVILNSKRSAFEEHLISRNLKVTSIIYKKKCQLVDVFFKILSFLFKQKPDIVHCHMFEASLVGLTAAKLVGVKKRIYTRHHSTLQHKYYPNGVKYDLWCNKMATHIIAISEVVKNVLINIESVDKQKIALIHHGFKLKEFQNIPLSRIYMLREKYLIPHNKFVIGTISRYLHLKGVVYIIEAFKEVLISNPNIILLLANASGDYSEVVKNELKSLPKNSYVEIEFEEDLFALYKLFNIFIHVPIDNDVEAFGQIYVEALASGVPSVFTLSGVGVEFIKNNYNAIVVNYQNSKEVKNAILELMKNNLLCQFLIDNGKKSVVQFDIKNCINKTEKLYLT